MWSWSTNVTDRQTDRQTDGRHAISIPRYALVHRAVKKMSPESARSCGGFCRAWSMVAKGILMHFEVTLKFSLSQGCNKKLKVISVKFRFGFLFCNSPKYIHSGAHKNKTKMTELACLQSLLNGIEYRPFIGVLWFIITLRAIGVRYQTDEFRFLIF